MFDNIYYFKKICKIGGTEQFLYEIAKKYHKYDITIFYDEADPYQLKRLRKYLRCKKRVKGEIVKCKKAFFNFNIDMIDDVEANEYIFVSHAIYQELGYKPPIDHPKLTSCIGVSQYSTDKLYEYADKLGIEIKAETCYDPLTIEPVDKVPIIVSACRLDDKVKGGERTLKLINALDRYCQKNNRNYLWLIFTNKTNINLETPNAVYMQPRVDVRPYIAMADWVAQLSNDMETYCYTTNEASAYGVPIITTPLSVYKEFDITDNERIILNWDCSNVDEVARLIFEKEVKPFKYTPPKDNWEDILVKGINKYKEELNMKAKVQCKQAYYDLELKRLVEKEEMLLLDGERADYLVEKGLVEILEKIENKKENKKLPTKKVEKRK